MTETIPEMIPFSYVLAVRNLRRTTVWFRDVLGFELMWPEGGGWQLAKRGSVRVMLGECPEAQKAADLGDHNYFAYLHVTNAAALHDEWTSRGATIVSPLTDQPHGMREFMVATPDGHRMMIGQTLDLPSAP